MKKTLIILIVFMTIVSCSKDDESANTFLESFDNTVWKFDYTGTADGPHHYYVKFTNNTYAPLEIWGGSSADNEGGLYTCAYYRLFNLDSKTMLVENTVNGFVLRFETDPNFWNTLTFSKSSDDIALELKNTNVKDLYQGKKSSKDVGSLKTCSSPLF